MRKKSTIIAALLIIGLLLTGCGAANKESSEKPLQVYSFKGSDNTISVANGVIVIDDKEEICYGGDVNVQPQVFSNVTSYEANIYINVDGRKEILLSNKVKDENGIEPSTHKSLGKIAGEVIKDNDVNNVADNLWFELKTKDKNGLEETYKLHLKTDEITDRGE